ISCIFDHYGFLLFFFFLCMHCYFFFFFFFFQAEDGIRDFHVTGVQTCALPISCRTPPSRVPRRAARSSCDRSSARASRRGSSPRSEERRVGKECRSRWSPEH